MTDSQSSEFARFEETVDTLNKVLETHRGELNKAKNVAKTGVLVGIIGIFLALIGGVVGLQGRSLARDIQSSRVEATLSSCIQSNVATQGSRTALENGVLVFAKDPANLTPNEQRVAGLYKTQVEKALPFRDCSPEGLVKYFKDPPHDPAQP